VPPHDALFMGTRTFARPLNNILQRRERNLHKTASETCNNRLAKFESSPPTSVYLSSDPAAPESTHARGLG